MRKNFGAKPILYPQPVFIIASYDENGKFLGMDYKEVEADSLNLGYEEGADYIGIFVVDSLAGAKPLTGAMQVDLNAAG